jgi:hypothetical protein
MSSEQNEDGTGASPRDPMEQVRELLFGETKRNVEQSAHVLEARVDAMRAEFLSRFASLESRLNELSRETKQDQAQSIETIGSAIAQLGDSLQTLGRQRKGG